MAIIHYEVLAKPLDRRLEDAACIYFEVTPDFFRVKKKEGTDRRRVLFWLLKTDTQMSVTEMSHRYGISKSSLSEGIDKLEFTKNHFRTIACDIENIRKIAANLVVNLVSVDVRMGDVAGDGVRGEVIEGGEVMKVVKGGYNLSNRAGKVLVCDQGDVAQLVLFASGKG